ncbi:hypothetical protein N665_0407s0029 [Sinapis alba]|nr:hypothetical protein N665_0407s0029 [Sinapis alba]
MAFKAVPAAYLKRQGYNPKEDFGDVGAFPEIDHIVQYPLGMGKNSNNNHNNNNSFVSKTLPITVDAEGNFVFNAIARQNENSKKIVYSHHNDIIPNVLLNNKGEEEETKAAIEKIVNNVRLRGAQDSKYIKYEQSCSEFNSGAKERIIRMVEKHVDPLDPPKFKHKRVPKASSGSPPVPVMHSPPRFVTVEDKQEWRIPPCISNWKNQKGYVIPLDKRLAADGRGLQDVEINDNFAKLAECMYVAEEKAREGVLMRSKVKKEMVVKEKERREKELRGLARKARYEREREKVKESREEREERMQREKIRREAKDAAMRKKRKISRDRDRDVSERVALGMAYTGGKGEEVMCDQRLFNQEKGMGSGFANDDDKYNVYDKGLFTAQPTLSTLYKPKKDTDEEMYGNVADDKVKNTERWFKPDKGFTGASGKREREEQDPFGLDRFVSDVKRGKKALDKIGSGGTMRASGGGGSSSRGDYGGGR